MMDKTYKIEITPKTILFIVFLLLSLQFVWIVRDLIFSLFIAFIVMSALKPPVYFLEKNKIPRIISTFIIFLIFFTLVIYFFAAVIPIIITETVSLSHQLPVILQKLDPSISQYINLDFVSQHLPNLTNNLFSLLGGIFSNAIFILSTIFFSFYFILEESFINKFLLKFTNQDKAEKIVSMFERIEKRMAAWFWGELTLMTVVGVMTFIGLTLIGVKYALPLAVIAGIFEVVPNLGPVLSVVPSFIVAISQSYFSGFSVLALYFIIQQLENNLIVPVIMKRAVGLNPIITLIALIVGGRVGGVLGVLLAIPVTLFLEVIISEYLHNHKNLR